MRKFQARLLTTAAALAIVGLALPAKAAPVLVNGSFEAAFTGWTHLNQAGGSGDWFIQTGTGSPLNGFPVPPPPDGTFAAMTDQGGPGSHVLYQDFLVPLSVSSANLSYMQFINNQNGAFITPSTLDFTAGANQQARVDIMDPAANPFSVLPADVYLNVYQTMVGDPAVSGYTNISTNLTALLQAHLGQTLRLRFAEVDNQFFFDMGVDQVNLDINDLNNVPEPASLLLLGTGIVVLARRVRRA